jgi:hypothetical protein
MAELEALSSKKAYEAFLAAAKAVDASAIEECRADIALVYHSVKRGVEGVLAQEAALGGLPQVKVEELRELPQLAQGLAFAVLQLHRDVEAASFGPLFAQAPRLRRKLLKAADALAEAGLVSDADAEQVRRLGLQDVVEDCTALVALLRRNEAKVAGHSPVTAADLDEAEQVAARLRGLLAPRGEGQGSLEEAARIRDRFWTLLTQRHELLWRCGAWLYGREVDERVPPLQARYTARPRVQAVPAAPQTALALAKPDNPTAAPPPPREKANPMRTLQRKIRALVSVSIGGRSSR